MPFVTSLLLDVANDGAAKSAALDGRVEFQSHEPQGVTVTHDLQRSNDSTIEQDGLSAATVQPPVMMLPIDRVGPIWKGLPEIVAHCLAVDAKSSSSSSGPTGRSE